MLCQVEPDAEQAEQLLQQPRRPLEQLGRLAPIPVQATDAPRGDAAALGPDQLGGAVQLVERGTDVHAIELERIGDQLAHQVGEAPAAHALDDLAHQVAVGEPMVARARAGLVGGGRALDGADHVLPVEHTLGAVDHAPDVVQARLVRQDVAHRDALLPCLRELGPVVGDVAIVVDEPPVGEDVQDGGGDPLRRGEARRHRVALPRAAKPVPIAAPQVDHARPVLIHAHGRAAMVLPEQAAQRLGNRDEVGVDEAVHGWAAAHEAAASPGAGASVAIAPSDTMTASSRSTASTRSWRSGIASQSALNPQ